MSEQSNHEPTMEEILASIRRIISEDEPEKSDAGPAMPESEPVREKIVDTAPISEPEPAYNAGVSEDRAGEGEYVPQFDREPQADLPDLDDDDDGDLELTQRVETHGDLDVLAPEPEALPEPALPPGPPPSIGTIVSDQVAAVASASFDKLAQNILMPAYGRTLEDVVREMLTPMLKDWLDTYLPDIVEKTVQAEVERIARGGVR